MSVRSCCIIRTLVGTPVCMRVPICMSVGSSHSIGIPIDTTVLIGVPTGISVGFPAVLGDLLAHQLVLEYLLVCKEEVSIMSGDILSG